METVAISDLPVAYAELNQAGEIVRMNAAGCAMIGLPMESVLGRPIWDFLPGDEVEASRETVRQAMETGKEPPVMRRSIYRACGAYRTHELHRRVLRDAAGKPVGLGLVTIDVSEAEMAYREARQTTLWMESALMAIPQAVIVTDALGLVRHMNIAAEKLTGWSLGELAGLPIERGLPICQSSSRSAGPLSFRLTLVEPWNGDVELVARSGEVLSVWLSASPVLDHDTGYVSGVVTVLGSPRQRPGVCAKESAEQVKAAS